MGIKTSVMVAQAVHGTHKGFDFLQDYNTLSKDVQKHFVDCWCKEERLWPRRLRESHAAMMMQLAVKDKNDGAFKFWQAVKIRNGENPNSADNRRVDLVRAKYHAPLTA